MPEGSLASAPAPAVALILFFVVLPASNQPALLPIGQSEAGFGRPFSCFI